MVPHHLLKLKDYLRHIDTSPTELDALYRDLLIHVTEFFRDEGAWIRLGPAFGNAR
jgi:chemotaxis methyl-accepting protein methylase